MFPTKNVDLERQYSKAKFETAPAKDFLQPCGGCMCTLSRNGSGTRVLLRSSVRSIQLVLTTPPCIDVTDRIICLERLWRHNVLSTCIQNYRKAIWRARSSYNFSSTFPPSHRVLLLAVTFSSGKKGDLSTAKCGTAARIVRA